MISKYVSIGQLCCDAAQHLECEHMECERVSRWPPLREVGRVVWPGRGPEAA